ncbi:MAG: PilN domain-containing protein [Bacillota bacterium]
MNIKINLLPPEIIARREQAKKQKKIITASVAAVVALLFIWGVLALITAKTWLDVSQIKKQRVALEEQSKQYQQYADMQAKVDQIRGLLRQAMGTPPEWEKLLNNIAADVPGGVWLTDISVKKEDKPAAQTAQNTQGGSPAAPAATASAGEMTIQGYASDKNSLADWLDQLNTVDGISDVRCQFLAESGQQMDQFEIKVKIKPGPAFDPGSGKVGG